MRFRLANEVQLRDGKKDFDSRNLVDARVADRDVALPVCPARAAAPVADSTGEHCVRGSWDQPFPGYHGPADVGLRVARIDSGCHYTAVALHNVHVVAG